MSDRKNIPVRSSSGNIGAGLTRINLGAGVASLLDDRKDRRTSPGAGLTPARTINLLENTMSCGAHTSGKRYQSAYSRLGGDTRSNSSAPNVSAFELRPTSRVSDNQGDGTVVSAPPRRSNIFSLRQTSDRLDGGFIQPKSAVLSTGNTTGVEGESNPEQRGSDAPKVSSPERFPKVSSEPSLRSEGWYSNPVSQRDDNNNSPQDTVFSSPTQGAVKVVADSNLESCKVLSSIKDENVVYNTNSTTSDIVTIKLPSSVQRNKSFNSFRQVDVRNFRTVTTRSFRPDTSDIGVDILKMTGMDGKMENKQDDRLAETIQYDTSMLSGTEVTPKQSTKKEPKPSPYDGLSARLIERQQQYRNLETDIVNNHPHSIAATDLARPQIDKVDGNDNEHDDDDPYASINDTTIDPDKQCNSIVSEDAPSIPFSSIISNTKVDTEADDTYPLPTPPRRTRTKSGDRATHHGNGQVLVLSHLDSESPPQPRIRMKRRLTKRNVGIKRVDEDEFIGFASLPEQVHRKAVRMGFEFTLMVVGETGLGKSTLINSLFLTDLYKGRKVINIEDRIQKTVDIERKELDIEERGVKLKLTIVDTPGFNDNVNAEESWKPIVQFINTQFDSYFKAESGLNRKNLHDTRVHCCLYFISPYGHGLRPVDISVMKHLHNKVNIVPLIAKADMLTKPEVKRLKEKVLREVERHCIQLYQFPDCDSDEDEDFKLQDKELKASIPFAVVGSNTVVEAGGKKIRGRMYPWGIVEVENPKHCDFIKLRQMLISTHMQDLKDVTCDTHYENYRAEHLAEQMYSQQKERSKLKRDSSPNLDAVVETDKLLQQKDEEIRRMQAMLSKMQAQLHSSNSPQINGRVGHQV